MTKPKRPPKNPNHRVPDYDAQIAELRRKRRRMQFDREAREWESRQPWWYKLFFGRYT